MTNLENCKTCTFNSVSTTHCNGCVESRSVFKNYQPNEGYKRDEANRIRTQIAELKRRLKKYEDEKRY